MPKKLTVAQEKILNAPNCERAFDNCSDKTRSECRKVVMLKRNHKSAYVLERLGFGRVATIPPFDQYFFLVSKAPKQIK